MKFEVNPRVALDIPEEYLELAQDKNPETRTYFWYVKNRPDEVRQESQCFDVLLSSIQHRPCSVLELFGGIGMFAAQIREKWGAIPHTLLDYSDICVRHLRQTYPDAIVIQTDSFDLSSPNQADFIVADFNRFTFLQYVRNLKLQARVDQLFASGPSYIEITDVACSKLHLNKNYYAAALGQPIEDIEGYVRAVSDYIYTIWGYRVKNWAKHHNATYLLFERIK